jgi:hypothetical protein
LLAPSPSRHSSTLLLSVSEGCIIGVGYYCYQQRPKSAANTRCLRNVRYAATYVLLFAYPVLSVKVRGEHSVASVLNVVLILTCRFHSLHLEPNHQIMQLFDCTEVEGVRYLRSDYSIECARDGQTDLRWQSWAVYGGVWLVLYVIGFPLLVVYKLWVRILVLLTSALSPCPDRPLLVFPPTAPLATVLCQEPTDRGRARGRTSRPRRLLLQ